MSDALTGADEAEPGGPRAEACGSSTGSSAPKIPRGPFLPPEIGSSIRNTTALPLAPPRAVSGGLSSIRAINAGQEVV
ncbi:hypothetical protein Mro03_36770 [Microbispora rosea subsp. rosea]|nr:hypothetical protein Mro03_36770 [Microbispora rosea subsp. rosea]